MIAPRIVPSPGDVPTLDPIAALDLTADYTVETGTILFSDINDTLIRFSAPDHSSDIVYFVNNGEIWHVGANVNPVFFLFNYTDFTNNNLIVTADGRSVGGVTAITASGINIRVLNNGDIYAISAEAENVSAVGIDGNLGDIENRGNIYVEGFSYGVGVWAIGSSLNLTNSGLIQVAANGTSTAVSSTSDGIINNFGTIEAFGFTDDTIVKAIQIYSSLTIVNSGTIAAAIAISAAESGGGTLNLDNAGEINGHIVISARWDDVIVNTGAITGNIYFAAGDDILTSADGTINGSVYGGFGNDELVFGAGDNIGYGEAGDDVLRGGAGQDLLVGGKGDDILEGGAGNDGLSGGFGNDTFILQGGDRALGFEQDDIFNISDGEFMLIDGGSGSDQLNLAAGLKLNLSAFLADGRLISIERLDLASGAGAALMAADIALLNDTGPVFVTGSGRLALYQSNWTNLGEQTQDGQVYQTFGSGSNFVYVSLDISVVISVGIPSGYLGPVLAGGQTPEIPVIVTDLALPADNPIVIYNDYMVYASESYHFEGISGQDGYPVGFTIEGPSQGLIGNILTNYGSITVVATQDASATAIFILTSGGVNNHGSLYARSDDNTAYGIRLGSEDQVANSGLIEVFSEQWAAFGIEARYNAHIINSGIINVETNAAFDTSSARFAAGVSGLTDLSFLNSGEIHARSAHIAIGIDLGFGEFLGGPDESMITNEGLIEAVATADDALSYGIRFYSIDDYTVINSGTIRAEIAFFQKTFEDTFGEFGTLNLTNTGNIFGDIMLSGGVDIITNSGTITGDVNFGGGADIYTTGPGGRIVGSLDLGAGNDRANLGGYADTVVGGSGNDYIYGGGANDIIDGGSGRDILNGGRGNDSLTGGAGADLFVIAAGAGEDIIEDFSSGTDHIEFRDGPYRFDQLKIIQNGNDTLIYSANGITRLIGVDSAALSVSDFIFRLDAADISGADLIVQALADPVFDHPIYTADDKAYGYEHIYLLGDQELL